MWTVLCGAAVTAMVVYGFGSMAWTAYITVPAFLLLAGWSIVKELGKHSLHSMATGAAPGPHLSLATGTTLVAGGFIVGMVITPGHDPLQPHAPPTWSSRR